jgi:hypothetical protein
VRTDFIELLSSGWTPIDICHRNITRGGREMSLITCFTEHLNFIKAQSHGILSVDMVKRLDEAENSIEKYFKNILYQFLINITKKRM